MGIYSIVVLSIAIFSIVIGLLSGMIRGLRRSILRIILVVLSLVLILIFNNTLIDIICDININGETLLEMAKSFLPEDLLKYEDIIMPMVLSLVSVITFILGFILLQLATLLIYWICCIFVKPKKNAAGMPDKKPFIGMFVGLVQGVIIAIAYGSIFTGLGNNVLKLTEVEMNGEKLIKLNEIEKNLDINIALDEYCESSVASVFETTGSFVYKTATTVEYNGKKYTFDGQIEALTKALGLANELNNLSQIDFSEGLTAENKEQVIEVLNNLDTMTSDMSEEVTQTLNEMVQTVAGDMIDVDLTGLDLSEVKFSKIADVVEIIDEVSENPTQENIDKIVTDLIDSNVIFVVIDATDLKIDEFDEETKNIIVDSIDKQDLTAEEEAKLKSFLGVA